MNKKVLGILLTIGFIALFGLILVQQTSMVLTRIGAGEGNILPSTVIAIASLIALIVIIKSKQLIQDERIDKLFIIGIVGFPIIILLYGVSFVLTFEPRAGYYEVGI